MSASARALGQQYEYLLYGSVSEANLAALLHRLRGLCDFATSGGTAFSDREIVLKIESQSASAKLHVRQSLDQPNAPWVLSYNGQLELGDHSRPTAVRTCVHTGCSHNVLDYLRELGFNAVTETIMKGYIFRKGTIRILVFRLYQPNDTGDVDSAQPFSNSYLVELSAVATSGQDSIGNEMKSFAEHLKSIVIMEKTDGIR